ncbi:AMP-binding protein [Gordonia rubripertincta]|uniref:AMP-binding protein n=1 Tax=Gordonia rubripertincta TaxID=36822 RepID=A0ABT4MUW2_GORRU|nr:AMP-binding protein [Gordonia rubripertincta]MCZ4550798.1 AMP-binding protein [Gordonia rubripertincta]
MNRAKHLAITGAHGVTHTIWMVRILCSAGFLALLRPDKYVRMIAALLRLGASPLTGIGLSAARSPRATAIIDERGSLSWAALENRSDALAVGLANSSTREPATIGILCRNHRGLVESLAAATKTGADALLLNTGFSGPQLAEVLVREGATTIMYDEEFSGLVAHARDKIEGLIELIAWCEDTSSGKTIDEIITVNSGNRPPKPKKAGRIILLTSGTTGTPKGARRSGGGGAGALAAMFERIPWRAEQTVVIAAPMFHAWGFGQMAVAASMTCTMVMRRRFDPEATLAMVDEHGARGLALVPVMLERIMDLPGEVLDNHQMATLRFATISGSRMRADAVRDFMDRFGDVVYNSYNATEAGLISTAVPADLRAAPDTAGRPAAGTDVRILDENFEELAAGDVGKIAVLSNSHFEGYSSGETKDFHGAFMLTGDMGTFDRAGRLFVVGRDDDMIVSGGENVFPLEVEETLHQHPSVLEAAVLGVDDAQYGQRLAAFVVLRPGQSAGADELKAHVKAQLAGFKAPRDVVFLDSLPRNATGKVVKRELPEVRDPGVPTGPAS